GEPGEGSGKHRVYRLMRTEGLRAQVGYGRRPQPRGGTTSIVAPNLLNREFNVAAPNTHWVTDITYIRTHEGWLYLATVIDLFSRQVVGWATGSRIDTQLPLDALHRQFGVEGQVRRSLFILIKAANLQAMNGKGSWLATTCSPA